MVIEVMVNIYVQYSTLDCIASVSVVLIIYFMDYETHLISQIIFTADVLR